jgi:hypothetical protein
MSLGDTLMYYDELVNCDFCGWSGSCNALVEGRLCPDCMSDKIV